MIITCCVCARARVLAALACARLPRRGRPRCCRAVLMLAGTAVFVASVGAARFRAKWPTQLYYDIIYDTIKQYNVIYMYMYAYNVYIYIYIYICIRIYIYIYIYIYISRL